MEPRLLTSDELLMAYEQLPLLPAWQWPSFLLALGYAGLSADKADDMGLPHRETLLLRLRRVHFGPGMRGRSVCPSCRSPNEVELDADALSAALPDPQGGAESRYSETDLPSGARARIAALSAREWAEAEGIGPAQAAGWIQGRALVDVRRDGDAVEWSGLDAADQDVLAKALAAKNEDVRVDIHCPACGQGDTRRLDMGYWLAHDIARAVQGLLREVDALARAYGWSESAILNLTPARRRLYLELVS